MEKLFWPRILPLFLLLAACMMACNDDDKPKLIPEVTTAPVTEITPTTAMGGGEITSDGNDQITVSGICWSNINTTPTTADSKSEVMISEGTFTSKMENLPSGSTIYVRAYATNNVGTGYGNVQTFMTGNAAPVATNVAITGTAEVNKTLTGIYTYTDAENNAEGGTAMQWYRATDGSGTGEVAIPNATSKTYVLQDADEFKYIRFGVNPKSSAGNINGTEVKSSFSGPIAVRTTVTFTYNGIDVTYGIITSSVTGRKWLDRNLGASSSPSSYDDFANYGDLFQWGRAADGHQLVTRKGPAASDLSAKNGTTTTLSTSDVPPNSLYIASGLALPRDWRVPQNENLWQGTSGINNPCPNGWKIPSSTEWDAEKLSALDAAYSQLKITNAGIGRDVNGDFVGTGYYWSSTSILNAAPDTNISTAYSFSSPALSNPKVSSVRSRGLVCRCIKGE